MKLPIPPELIAEHTPFPEPSPEDLMAWEEALQKAAEELGCLAGENTALEKVPLPFGGVRTAYELEYQRQHEEEE